MIIGKIRTGGQDILISKIGPDWFNFTRAMVDMRQIVEGEAIPEPTDVRDLIITGWFTRSHVCRVTEFVQRHNRLDQYRVSPPEQWLPPCRVGKILAMGRNYHAHVREFDNQVPDIPVADTPD